MIIFTKIHKIARAKDFNCFSGLGNGVAFQIASMSGSQVRDSVSPICSTSCVDMQPYDQSTLQNFTYTTCCLPNTSVAFLTTGPTRFIL